MNSEGELSLPEIEAALVQGPTGQPGASSAPALSPDEYLLQALEAHLGVERASLAQYRALAESTQDPIVALIMDLVLEDEERHHTLLRRLAARLKDDLEWAHTPEALPSPTAAPADPAAYEALGAFVASERAGIHELENFAGRADGLYGGLATELLEMMALDSRKHERLLRYLFRRVGQTITAARPAP
jgi:rubrerythrin